MMQLPLDKFLIRYGGSIFNVAVPGTSEFSFPVMERHLKMYCSISHGMPPIMVEFEQTDHPSNIILIKSINQEIK
jgi:hypothetical protein